MRLKSWTLGGSLDCMRSGDGNDESLGAPKHQTPSDSGLSYGHKDDTVQSDSDPRAPCAVRSKQMSTPTLVDKVEAMAALACVKELTPAAIKIGLRLLHHFNCRTGRCDPGIEILAAATGLAERSVYRAIEELAAVV